MNMIQNASQDISVNNTEKKLTLKILPFEEKNNDKTNIKNFEKYIIGESPSELKDLQKAVQNEYDFEIRPSVSSKLQQTKGGTNRNHIMEKYASLMIQHSLSKDKNFQFSMCPDACRADVLISINDSSQWLGIQVKTTTGLSKSQILAWVFDCIDKEYTGLLMYFRSLNDGMAWMIPYNFLRIYYKGSSLHIGGYSEQKIKTKIDWKKFQVSDKNLAVKLIEYYNFALNNPNELNLQTNEILSKPITIKYQKEHHYRKEFFPLLQKMNLQIRMPTLENDVYDFVLGEIKIQEKVSIPATNMGLYVDTVRNKCNYVTRDFGIFLIHNPGLNCIYFIPMSKLNQHGYINENIDDHCRKTLTLYPPEIELSRVTTKDNWTLDYMFYKDDPNFIQKLHAVYEKVLTQHNRIPLPENPIIWNRPIKIFNDIVIKWNMPREYASRTEKYDFLLYNKKILLRGMFLGDPGMFRISLCRSVKGEIIYLENDDTDYIYCDMPLGFEGFYLIPVDELDKIDVLKTETKKGKKFINIPGPFKNTTKYKSKFSFLNAYAFYFNDVQIREKLMKLLGVINLRK